MVKSSVFGLNGENEKLENRAKKRFDKVYNYIVLCYYEDKIFVVFGNVIIRRGVLCHNQQSKM